MRPYHLLSFLLLASISRISASAFAAARSGSGAFVGGWTGIKETSDPHVMQIANFAVTEHNKQSGENLKLVKVVEGQTQVVARINYRLVLAANSGTGTNNYEAIVLERAWQDFRNLIFFAPLLQ